MNPFHSQDSKPSHSHFKATRLKLGPCASPASPHRVAGWLYRMAMVREKDQVNGWWKDRFLRRK